jgi:hypothetical protein
LTENSATDTLAAEAQNIPGGIKDNTDPVIESYTDINIADIFAIEANTKLLYSTNNKFNGIIYDIFPRNREIMSNVAATNIIVEEISKLIGGTS